MEKYEISKNINGFNERLKALKTVINIDQTTEAISGYEQQMLASDFWDNPKIAAEVVQKCNDLKETLEEYNELKNRVQDLEEILSFNDESLLGDIADSISSIARDLEEFEVKLMLSGEYDHLNAIIEIHPGAGGTEAQDWALMLYRMYRRFAERHNFDVEVLEYQDGLEAGLKSVTMLVKGKNAYGILKGEKGVHRLVRISPFDSNARRHTSFAACNVLPEISHEIDVTIKPEEIKIDTYRSSGAGGQHVNTTDSAVRITHLETGIVVTSQNERSQIQNREKALNLLKSKLYQLEIEARQNKIKNISGHLGDNAFGNQIRSYVLHPYALVKDLRTDAESTNPQEVLDGDLDLFINAYLRYTESRD
ncbi:MAG: peptide chain release factor 2 [Bacilli bacterium]|jgi:peptide chain release factor 2|nr:peptide chain release factor 2 [Acholeplasmataceae bacterium]